MILFFYTALKLTVTNFEKTIVWWSFSFTLLSNRELFRVTKYGVWWSFSFTLLSNQSGIHALLEGFDDPFLLHCSQTACIACWISRGLMILFFYTALKQRTGLRDAFRVWWSFSFTLLSNKDKHSSFSGRFDDPFLLHCSQTQREALWPYSRFDDPFLLHCSQTLGHADYSV